MADNSTYKYKVKGLVDASGVISAIKKVRGVVSVSFKDDTLTYVIDKWTDEYDVLVAAINACDAVGAELIVGEEESVSDYDYDAIDNNAEFEDNGVIDGDIDVEEGFEEEPTTAENKTDVGYEEDRLISGKKKLKTESLIRFIELGVSMILLVLSFFVKPNEEVPISFKNVLVIVSFALSVYEIFYAALLDAVKKKWYSESIYISLACVLGAFVNAITEIAALALLFAVAKEIQTYVEGLCALRVDERFYTGSFSVKVDDGSMKKAEALAEGDIIYLDKFDVVPCDCRLLEEAKFDCYNVGGGVEEKKGADETVLAGSMLLDDGAKLQVTAANSDSVIVAKRRAFEEKTAHYSSAPSFVNFLSLGLFLIACAIAFALPAFYAGGYAKGLEHYGKIAVVVAFCSTLSYMFTSTYLSRRSVAVLYETLGISFADDSAIVDLGRSNSFVFDADALTENGAIKADAFGALRETLDTGAKNVTTNFDGCELSEEVKNKIDFVDRSFKNEKKTTVGKGKDVSLSGDGKINIASGEISFVPLAYRLARKAVKRERASVALFALSFVAAIVGIFVIPAKISVLFAAFPLVAVIALSSVFAADCALTRP